MTAEKIDRKYSQEEIDWIVRGMFQCFRNILKNERTVGNFGKGEVTIPVHYAPLFKPYKKLRDACLDLPVEDMGADRK